MGQITWQTADQVSANTLAQAKTNRKAYLSMLCNQAITGGFQSSALGVAHTYPSDMEAQANFNTEVSRYAIDPNYTQSNIKTIDAGYLVHTKDQFFQMFKDGHDFGANQIAHLNTLKGQIDAVTITTDLNTAITAISAITW